MIDLSVFKMDLIKQLEALRISRMDLVCCSLEKYDEYIARNEAIDDCIKIVEKWIKENNV